MQKLLTDQQHETFNKLLCDEDELKRYKRKFDDYKPSLLPRILGGFLVFSGNIMYGKKPSLLKFRAIEVIARVPYHSWSSASYTHLTLFFTDEERAVKYSESTRFADVAQANETMHVVVISCMTEKVHGLGHIRFTMLPILFSFFYFWASYLLYLLNPRMSYELNFLFESHAFSQYDEFIQVHEKQLRAKSIESCFLDTYGRKHENQYEFFKAVRNDELIHRNQSLEQISKL